MMMTILFVLCLFLLDFQRPPVTDPLGKQFVVTEVLEQSTSGCTTNPSAGRPSNHEIFVDFADNDDQHAAESQSELPLRCNKPLRVGR